MKKRLLSTAYSGLAQRNSIVNHRDFINFHQVLTPKNAFTISSYNLLSRHYLWHQVYNYLPSHWTNWDNRFKLINENMNDLCNLSDIMCFQEMEYLIYHDYWKGFMLERNFDSVFQKKRKPQYWQKNLNMMDGVSIFVNKEKFKILNYEQIDLADYFKNKIYFKQTPDLKKRLNCRNTVALIVVLEHLPTGKTLFLSNTHLYWSPKHPDVKLMQTFLLTKLLQRAVQRQFKLTAEETKEKLETGEGLNVFMVGDFNSVPDSPVYRFLSEGKIDCNKYKEVCEYDYGVDSNSTLDTSFQKFSSPYHDLFEEDKFQKTTYTQNFKQIIDYIWYNKSSDQLRLVKVLGDIESNYLKGYPGLPNEEFPSDHFPILAQFELSK